MIDSVPFNLQCFVIFRHETKPNTVQNHEILRLLRGKLHLARWKMQSYQSFSNVLLKSRSDNCSVAPSRCHAKDAKYKFLRAMSHYFGMFCPKHFPYGNWKRTLIGRGSTSYFLPNIFRKPSSKKYIIASSSIEAIESGRMHSFSYGNE